MGLDFLNRVSRELKSELLSDHMSYMNRMEKQKKPQVWHPHSRLHCKAEDSILLWFIVLKTASDQYPHHYSEFCLCEQELSL